MTNLYDELQWRGVVYDATDGLREQLAATRVTAYIGFDPTAPSLHVGSLLQLVTLSRLQRAGHTPVAIAGGGTGMIGDPSGKTQERKLLSPDEIEANVAGIRKQLEHYLDFTARKNPARIVNNAEWLAPLSMMEFLRGYGKHFSVNEMLARDSVKNRLSQEQGISFTEF